MGLLSRSATNRLVRSFIVFLCLAAVIASSGGCLKLSGEAQIVSLFPRDGAVSVSRTASVVAWMDQPIDRGWNRWGLRLQDQQGNEVGGRLEVGADRESLVLEPAAEMAPGRYVASVTQKEAPPESAREVRTWTFTVPEKPSLEQGPGGSILLIIDAASDFSAQYAEILRMEGLNSFETITVDDLTPELLGAHDLAILGTGHVDPATARTLAHWVGNENGNLIAMEPTGPIAELAGVVNRGPGVPDGYVRIDTSQAPGKGIVAESMQFHGESSRLELKGGTRAIAWQDSAGSASKGTPAVTVRPGAGGRGTVAAYSFNLAQSTVLTRQGNLEWAGQERDGIAPIRSDDLFFGGGERDYLDLSKVHIPQADEHLRLFSNLVGYVNQGNGPMPKFWYLPNSSKAALVLAADDHGTLDGTSKMFERLSDLSPEGCSVEAWECFRATSWLYPESGLTPAQAKAFSERGFDVGAHVSTGCRDWDARSLTAAFSQSLGDFRKKYPGLPPQTGNRLHCIAWSQWSTQARIERSWGMRIDMNYYYWPGDWVRGRAGFMTGSGLPMRFSDAEGNLINVFQQETHLVDEVFADHLYALERLLERATGPEGFYGAFGTHVDFTTAFDVDLMEMAIRHAIPIVSAQQLLEWTDARNASSFDTVKWDRGEMSFSLDIDPQTHGMLKAMLPVQSTQGTLTEIRSRGQRIDVVNETIKGVDYAIFDAISGTYAANYG